MRNDFRSEIELSNLELLQSDCHKAQPFQFESLGNFDNIQAYQHAFAPLEVFYILDFKLQNVNSTTTWVRSFISTSNSEFHRKKKRTERWSLAFLVEHKRTYQLEFVEPTDSRGG